MILFEVTDNIAIISIASGKGNLINYNDLEMFDDIIVGAKNDPKVKSIIITGDKSCFSTGLDLSEIEEGFTDNFFLKFDNFLLNFFSFPKPVICAISGHSIGGGLLIQACADYVVSSDAQRIKTGLPEIKIGLTVDTAMVSLLGYRLTNKSLEMLLYSAEYIDVENAKEIGLIDELTSSDLLMDKAMQAAVRLQSFSSAAFYATKTNLRNFTIEQMRYYINKECSTIFRDLKFYGKIS